MKKSLIVLGGLIFAVLCGMCWEILFCDEYAQAAALIRQSDRLFGGVHRIVPLRHKSIEKSAGVSCTLHQVYVIGEGRSAFANVVWRFDGEQHVGAGRLVIAGDDSIDGVLHEQLSADCPLP